jgi:hypothetical protein
MFGFPATALSGCPQYRDLSRKAGENAPKNGCSLGEHPPIDIEARDIEARLERQPAVYSKIKGKL